jgi:P4 family phage/plasmid primase-like protien
MSKGEPKTIDGFLKKYQTKGDDKPSHTRIGNPKFGIYGGSYNIPPDKMQLFYELYHYSVFECLTPNYITECQLPDKGPLLIDLDERYKKSVTDRHHSEEHITDFTQLVLEKLTNIIKVDGTLTFKIYVFEKDEINTDCVDFTKDGVHYYFDVELEHGAKPILREHILEDIDFIYEDLKLENSYSDLVDKGVMIGKTNWQLYGSRKPSYQDYKIKYLYEAEIINDVSNIDSEESEESDSSETIINISKLKINDLDILELLPLISARKNCEEKLVLKDKIKQQITSAKIKKKPVAHKQVENSMMTMGSLRDAFGNIDSEENCSQLIKEIIDYSNKEGLNNIEYAHNLAMLLSDEYYEPYENWLKVSWCLRSISMLLYPTFLLFSSKSPRFDWDDNDCYKEWTSCNYDIEKSPSLGSLKFMAKKCDKDAVAKLDECNFYNMITAIAKGPITEWDIASMVHKIFEYEFKSCNIKKTLWYHYKNGRWREDDSGITLRSRLSAYISKQIHNIVDQKIIQLSSESDDSEKNDADATLVKNMTQIAANLKRTTWKQNIMKECQEVFFDKEFINKLDVNPDLMCFNNGVLDLKQKVFREGFPTDNLSLCTNTDYIEFDEGDEDSVRIREEILEFMKKLFPIPAVNKYMWQHMASILKGRNKNQTFNIYMGSGRNGKSKFVELLGLVLGDYKGSVPLTLITRERTGLGQATPEIAQLKGLRYAVIQEPSKSTKLNEGPMKELVGEDPIQGRSLFKDTITFVPQFKLVVCTNNLFEINSNDDGTWRRIRLCDFIAKFVDDPSPDPKDYEFQRDCEIDKKFKSWAQVLTSMLVEIVFETDGLVEDCEEVMASSKKYRNQQDCFSEFVKERIVKSEKDTIQKMNLKQEFEEWFSDLYSTKMPSGKELYSNISEHLGEPVSRSGNKRGWVGWKLITSHDLECEDDNIPVNNI